jgi:hypothetical protein
LRPCSAASLLPKPFSLMALRQLPAPLRHLLLRRPLPRCLPRMPPPPLHHIPLPLRLPIPRLPCLPRLPPCLPLCLPPCLPSCLPLRQPRRLVPHTRCRASQFHRIRLLRWWPRMRHPSSSLACAATLLACACTPPALAVGMASSLGIPTGTLRRTRPMRSSGAAWAVVHHTHRAGSASAVGLQWSRLTALTTTCSVGTMDQRMHARSVRGMHLPPPPRTRATDRRTTAARGLWQAPRAATWQERAQGPRTRSHAYASRVTGG